MKKLSMGIVSVALLYLTIMTGCIKADLGSDNKCKNCTFIGDTTNTVVHVDTTGNGNNNTNPTPITLLNIKIGSNLVLYGNQENGDETIPEENRTKQYVNYMNPMSFSWTTSQPVKVLVDVRITDFAYNSTVISKLTPPEAYGDNGTYQFPHHIPKGLYILSAAITLIDPNNSASNKTYNFVYPLCVQ